MLSAGSETDEINSNERCRFGITCQRVKIGSCNNWHPSCRNGVACLFMRNKNCRYFHPRWHFLSTGRRSSQADLSDDSNNNNEDSSNEESITIDDNIDNQYFEHEYYETEDTSNSHSIHSNELS